MQTNSKQLFTMRLRLNHEVQKTLMPHNNWQEQIQQCRSLDQHRLRQQLKHCKTPDDYATLEKRIEKSSAVVKTKSALIPAITYPANLPVSEKHAEIAKTINANQVTIVAGETGSGKTTQIPKICLALGLGRRGIIGHTQPRRIAARTVASRISDELANDADKNIAEQLVSYQVRFHDTSSDHTAIKLMTDGVLLAEIRHDRFLNKYDTIIIDEAHERSLNIDFLLGYLKILIKKRRDLKVIITSATIDLEKFSRHFDNAPIIQVSGRTYPVETLYQPLDKDDELSDTIVDTIKTIIDVDKSSTQSRRDILVFCAGEREIREASTAIRKAQLKVDTVPLYARLSLAEQNRAFASSLQRKVILATNVAETSITVPNIGYVIDPGFARISRYSHRSKIQRLPIEAISQASANQRKGRCGRVADGICFRLYEEEDFTSRAEFTEAEILRSNLAAVILKMIDLGLGDIREFPFIDAPDERLINDGYQLLKELQAITPSAKLSNIGKTISQLPIDPRYGRMLAAAQELRCLEPVLIIVSGLSIQDPREYPAEKKQAAEEKHKQYQDKKSDFVSLLNLWQTVETQRQALTNKQFKQWCSEHFIAFMRMLEWRDLHRQLLLSCQQLGWSVNSDIDKLDRYSLEYIHRAILSGLLGNIAQLDYKKDYIACRNHNVNIFPGSGQFNKKPKWFVANEFIETSKVYAHTVASILPEWVLKTANHLVKRHYFEPYYDKKTGLVNAYEKTSLYGLTLIEKKSVYFGKIDPVESRHIFIREALVAGNYQTPGREDAAFYQHNQNLIAEIETIEAKYRRRNLLVDDQVLIDFYEERLPEKIINLASFERWRTQTEKQQAQLLFFDKNLLLNDIHYQDDTAQFPNMLDLETMTLPLHYHFEIGSEEDGLSLQLPLHLLHQCPRYTGDWLVPGLLEEKCIALIRQLPKDLRKQCVPIPETVLKILPELQRRNEALHQQLALQLKRHLALNIQESDWSLDNLDQYYRLNYQLLDENDQLIDQDRDLFALQQRHKQRTQKTIQSQPAQVYQRDKFNSWDMEQIQEQVSYLQEGIQVIAYPYLQDNIDSVSLKLANQPESAAFLHKQGLLRLACMENQTSYKYLQKEIINVNKSKQLALQLLSLSNDYIEDIDTLRDHIILTSMWQSCFQSKEGIREQHIFHQAIEQGKADWIPIAFDIEKVVSAIVELLLKTTRKLDELADQDDYAEMLEDIHYQLEHLFAEDFLLYSTLEQLKHYPRYLQAIDYRLQKCMTNYDKEISAIDKINTVTHDYYEVLNRHGYAQAYFRFPEVLSFRMLFEEWRVSLFAQQLKTAMPVSEKRLLKQWQDILQNNIF